MCKILWSPSFLKYSQCPTTRLLARPLDWRRYDSAFPISLSRDLIVFSEKCLANRLPARWLEWERHDTTRFEWNRQHVVSLCWFLRIDFNSNRQLQKRIDSVWDRLRLDYYTTFLEKKKVNWRLFKGNQGIYIWTFYYLIILITETSD